MRSCTWIDSPLSPGGAGGTGMSEQVTPAINPEADRQQRANELSAEQGADWSDQYRPGSFGCHEFLDRTSLVADLIERSLLAHPACVQNAGWFALADQAASTLRELYQRIAAQHLDVSEGTPA